MIFKFFQTPALEALERANFSYSSSSSSSNGWQIEDEKEKEDEKNYRNGSK